MKLYAKPGSEWAEDRLVGLWCPVLTGGTGSTLLDSNPSTNGHGTLTGFTGVNTAWVGTQIGTALDFSATANRATMTSPSISQGDFTIFLWLRVRSITGGYMVLFERGTEREPSVFLRTDGNISYTAVGTTQDFALRSLGIVVGRWNLYTMTRQGGIVSHFLNGAFRSSITGLTSTQANATEWTLGAAISGLGSRFDGQIAEFFPLRTVANQGQIMQAYQAGPGGLWQTYPRRPRSYFAQVLTTYRNRSSRYLCFPG